MSMQNLKIALYQRINSAHEYQTYENQAPQEGILPDGTRIPTPYPYVVYKLSPVSPTESNRDDFNLEVSCWDKTDYPDYTRITTVAEIIKSTLEDFRYLDDKIFVLVTRPSIGYVPDPDPNIKRYDVRALVKMYRR